MASIPLEVVISATDRFSGTAGKVTASLRAMDRAAYQTGKGIAQTAMGLTRLGFIGAAAGVAGLTAVAKATISWESALAGVNKTMDFTNDPNGLAKLGLQIRGLATEIPLSATAIAGLVEQAGALGIAKENVVQFAKAAALIGVTTNVSADQAATSLGVMSNLLALTGDDYDRFGSTLVDLGNKGASTEAQIISMAERVAGAGSTLGMNASQILGIASAISNVGIEAEAGGTAVSTVLIEMAKFASQGGAELKTLAEASNMTAAEFKKAFEEDAAGAFESFIDGLATMSRDERIQTLGTLGWDDRRVMDMLSRLAEAEKNNDNLSKSLNVSAEAWRSNSAMAEEADKRFGTVASKLALLKNQAIEGALLIGEGFLPALGRVADKLKVALADPEFRATLTEFGKQIGDAIDGIDFQKLLADVRGLGRAFRDDVLPVLHIVASLVSALPTSIKAAGAALLIGVNTPVVSGAITQIGKGIANIILGSLGMVGSMLPGPIGPVANRLFAQPVFVTNWPMGGLGGAPGGRGPGGPGLGLPGGLMAPGLMPALVAAAVPFAMFYGIPAIVKAINGPGSGVTTNEQAAINTPGGGSVTGPNAGTVRLYTPALRDVPGNKVPMPGYWGGASNLNKPYGGLSPDDRDTVNAVNRVYNAIEAIRTTPPVVNVYITTRDLGYTVSKQGRIGPPNGSHGRGRGALE